MQDGLGLEVCVGNTVGHPSRSYCPEAAHGPSAQIVFNLEPTCGQKQPRIEVVDP